jgi:ubiquinone/menaquinone biosynthesis C-methylase UbiE
MSDPSFVGSPRWSPGGAGAPRAELIEFLERAGRASPARDAAERWFDVVPLRQGQRVIDAGCGIGLMLPRLARAVGSSGHVVGLDHAEDLLERARERVHAEALDAVVELRRGDINGMDFPAGTFDIATTERVLMHQEDPTATLRELRRIVKPGGFVVAVEPDLRCCRLDGNVDVEAIQLMLERLVKGVRHPSVGSELYRRMHDAGLLERQLVPVSAIITRAEDLHFLRLRETSRKLVEDGLLSQERVNRALAGLEESGREGTLACFVGYFIAVGRVPAET